MMWFRAILLTFLLACALPAAAQDLAPAPIPDLAPDFPSASPTRKPKLDIVCAQALTRFCPALDDVAGQTSRQVTCLKPYRSSLPLVCRRSVNRLLK